MVNRIVDAEIAAAEGVAGCQRSPWRKGDHPGAGGLVTETFKKRTEHHAKRRIS
jgi:hypothetical protein